MEKEERFSNYRLPENVEKKVPATKSREDR